MHLATRLRLDGRARKELDGKVVLHRLGLEEDLWDGLIDNQHCSKPFVFASSNKNKNTKERKDDSR